MESSFLNALAEIQSPESSLLSEIFSHPEKDRIINSILEFHIKKEDMLGRQVRIFSEQIKLIVSQVKSQDFHQSALGKEHALLLLLVESDDSKHMIQSMLNMIEKKEAGENFSPSN